MAKNTREGKIKVLINRPINLTMCQSWENARWKKSAHRSYWKFSTIGQYVLLTYSGRRGHEGQPGGHRDQLPQPGQDARQEEGWHQGNTTFEHFRVV